MKFTQKIVQYLAAFHTSRFRAKTIRFILDVFLLSNYYDCIQHGEKQTVEHVAAAVSALRYMKEPGQAKVFPTDF